MTTDDLLDLVDSELEAYRAEQRDLAARVFDFAAPVPPRSSGTAGEGSVASPANPSPADGDPPRMGDSPHGRSTSAGEPFAPGESTHNGRWEASATDTGLDAPQRDQQRTLPTPPAWLDRQLRRIRLRVAWRTAAK